MLIWKNKSHKNNLTDEGAAVFPNKLPPVWVAPKPPKPELAVVVVVDPNSDDWVVLAPKRLVPVVLPNNPPDVAVLPKPKLKIFEDDFKFLKVCGLVCLVFGEKF